MKEERPEKVPDLKLLVEKKFLALQDKNSDADFRDNEKFAQYKQQLRELKKQCKSAALLWFLDVRDLTREQFRTTGLLVFSPLLASSSRVPCPVAVLCLSNCGSSRLSISESLQFPQSVSLPGRGIGKTK